MLNVIECGQCSLKIIYFPYKKQLNFDLYYRKRGLSDKSDSETLKRVRCGLFLRLQLDFSNIASGPDIHVPQQKVSRYIKGIFEEKGKVLTNSGEQRGQDQNDKNTTLKTKKQMNNMDPTKNLGVDSGAPEE